jgi:riboflavin kinase/FMN adenylyltransferase
MGSEAKFLGVVSHGEKRGRHLGFPTANLTVSVHHDLPLGIYASATRIHGLGEEEFASVSYLGTKPTFGGREIVLETHILDFSQDIYGAEIEVDLLDYIREDSKFKSEVDLIAQMQEDILRSRTFHLQSSHLLK